MSSKANTLREKVINAVCFKPDIMGHIEQFERIEALITEARIDEVQKALSFNTMRDLEDRYYHLVDSTGGTPFKQKFVSKAELKEDK